MSLGFASPLIFYFPSLFRLVAQNLSQMFLISMRPRVCMRANMDFRHGSNNSQFLSFHSFPQILDRV